MRSLGLEPLSHLSLFLPFSSSPSGLTPVALDGSKERSIKLLTYPDYPFRSTNQKVTKRAGERSLRSVAGVCSIRNEV